MNPEFKVRVVQSKKKNEYHKSTNRVIKYLINVFKSIFKYENLYQMKQEVTNYNM